MKQVLLLFIVIFSFVNFADAQWYNRTCGVSEINNCTLSEYKCLWEDASNIVHRNGIAAVIGTSCIVAGGIVVALSDKSTFLGFYSTGVMIGGLVISGGIIVDCISLPILLVGANRKAQLRETPNYEALNFRTLNISPTINRSQFNNTYSLGLSAYLRF